jgi:HEAT repeat protein
MSHIFISYNHNDGDFADNLKEKIKKAGFEPWIDIAGLRAGKDWRAEIDQAIKGASALIVVMTPRAKESEYVTYEWAFALGAGVKVIPVLLKPTEIHPRLGALQYLDFTNRMSRPWDKLIEALQKAVDHAPYTIRLPPDVPLAIKQAVATLDSASPAERQAAIKTLAQTNHPAAREALAEAVQHPVRDVRIHAALALVQFRDARAVPGLLEALRDKNLGVRIGTAKGLGRIGSAAVPGLLDALRDKDGGVRQYAAEMLGEIGDATAVPSLIDALRDEEDGYIRNVAIPEALKQIGTPEALAAVEEWSRRQQGGAAG